jgi:hypothetical protein
MRWWDKLHLRLRSLLARDAVEQDLDTELRFHLEEQIAENVAAECQRRKRAARHCVPSGAWRRSLSSAGTHAKLGRPKTSSRMCDSACAC